MNSEHLDPYTEMAITGEQDFELRGSGLVVPLSFKPDAAFVLRTLVSTDEELLRNHIAKLPEFDKICGDAYPISRFNTVIHNLRFTFDALNATVIQVPRKQGANNVYRRNPDYIYFDER